jgi:hypothetical protein
MDPPLHVQLCGVCGKSVTHVGKNTKKRLRRLHTSYVGGDVLLIAILTRCTCRIPTVDPTQVPSVSIKASSGGLPSLGKRR